MTMTEVLSAALALSESDRREVIERLSLSLCPDDNDSAEEAEQALLKEIQRRSDDYHAGRADLVDWHDALQSVRNSLKAADE